MNLTSEELRIVSYGRSRLSQRYPLLDPERDVDYNILSLRFTLATPNSFGLSASQVLTAKTALCKLLHDNGGDAYVSPYVVESDAAYILDRYAPIRQLMEKYQQQYGRTSLGQWNRSRYEQVVYAFLLPQYSPGSTVVFSRRTMRDLLHEYQEQEEASATQVKTTRVTLLTDLVGSSPDQRKVSAYESRGRCFCCGAPKPRKVACVICGYTPRGG